MRDTFLLPPSQDWIRMCVLYSSGELHRHLDSFVVLKVLRRCLSVFFVFFLQVSVPLSVPSVTRPSTKRVPYRYTRSNTQGRSPTSVKSAASASHRRATWSCTWRGRTAMVSHRHSNTQNTHSTSALSLRRRFHYWWGPQPKLAPISLNSCGLRYVLGSFWE